MSLGRNWKLLGKDTSKFVQGENDRGRGQVTLGVPGKLNFEEPLITQGWKAGAATPGAGTILGNK